MTWRAPTRAEIHEYYTTEFPTYLDELPGFITPTGPKEFGIAFQTPYPVRDSTAYDRDFIRRQTQVTPTSSDSANRRSRFPTQQSLLAFIQHPARNDPLTDHPHRLVDPDLIDIPEPVANGVYYAADNWERSWILFVDIDAKTIARNHIQPSASEPSETTGTIEEQLHDEGIYAAPPTGYPYRFSDIERAIEHGFETKRIFESSFNASHTMVVYTGQGVHVYLLDDDRTHAYDEHSREALNDILQEKFEIPLDPVVTADRSRLIRLPFSLHTDVSRIVRPIDDPDYDFRTNNLPGFLQ